MTTPEGAPELTGPAPSGAVLGGVTQARNRVTSVLEESVRSLLREAGYRVPKQKMAVWCHHPDKPQRLLPLTPDIVFIGKRLAIEVDPCGLLTSHRGASHRGKETDDLRRNQLLEAVGWTVLRLRLGAEKGMQIGARDVVCESSALTADAAQALLAAVDDAIEKREPLVRFVSKKSAALPRKAPIRRSSVVRLAEYTYGDQAHIFSWLPDLESSNRVHLRLAFDGRFLYTHDQPPRFIGAVGLNELPHSDWKTRLQEVLPTLARLPLAGAGKYPWGEELLVAESLDQDAVAIVNACEWKCDIDRADYYFTINCERLASATDSSLLDEAGHVIVRLHPRAADLGYRFVGVERLNGYRGPYERITLTRRPAAEP